MGFEVKQPNIMKKNLQSILIILTISFGVAARLSILGWLAIIGLVSIVILVTVHLIVHFYSMNYLSSMKSSCNSKILISHLSFLGIFLFQFDFDDSRNYSVIGNIFGLNSEFLISFSYVLVSVSLVVYIFTNILVFRKARADREKGSNLKYLIASILVCVLLIPTFVIAPQYISYKKFEKEYNSEDYSELLEDEVNPEFLNSIALAERIENRDSSYRWVNQILIQKSLEELSRYTILAKVDSVCIVFSDNFLENDIIYNFYFSNNEKVGSNNVNRIKFFDNWSFESLYNFHYRVDLHRKDSIFQITKRKLFKNIQEEYEEQLIDAIQSYINEINNDKDQQISILIEDGINQRLSWLKFMIKDKSGERSFGFINIITKKIEYKE